MRITPSMVAVATMGLLAIATALPEPSSAYSLGRFRGQLIEPPAASSIPGSASSRTSYPSSGINSSAALSSVADLSITKTYAGPVQGSHLFYIQVKNSAGATANSVIIYDQLPAGWVLDTTYSPNCTGASNTVMCKVPSIMGGRTHTQMISVRWTGYACQPTITNTAWVFGGTPEITYTNNTVTMTAPIRCGSSSSSRSSTRSSATACEANACALYGNTQCGQLGMKCRETNEAPFCIECIAPQSSTSSARSSSFSSAQSNLFLLQTSLAPSRQLLGGALSDPILKLTLIADKDPITVRQLHFTASGTARSIDRLELYLLDASAPFATATLAACGSVGVPSQTFCASMTDRQLVLPGRNINQEIHIRARMKNDLEGGMSGDFFTISLGGEGAVRAINDVTNYELKANDGDSYREGEIFIGATAGANRTIVSQTHMTVLSKILNITNANADVDGSAIPVGGRPIAKFKFTAAGNDNANNGRNVAHIATLLFKVAADNVNLSTNSFKIFNVANSAVTSPCTVKDSSGNPVTGDQVNGLIYVLCDDMHTAMNAGVTLDTPQTFALFANVTNPKLISTQPSSLMVTLGNFSNIKLNGTFGPQQSNLNWIDKDTIVSKMYQWIESTLTVVRSTKYQD